ESGAPQTDEGELQFHLERNPNNDETWSDILGAPRIGDNFTKKKVSISVGLQDEYALPSIVDSFRIIRVQKEWFWACVVGVAFYLISLMILAKRKGLLRDRGINLTVIGIPSDAAVGPYSLGRFQMAFWFSLVIVS